MRHKVVNELIKENATKYIRNVVYVYDRVECFMETDIWQNNI
jgi:hypothetical protein